MNGCEQMARIIRWLDAHCREQPSLEILAEQAQLSPARLHREFQRWVGIPPKDFVRGLARDRIQAMLRQGAGGLRTAPAAGHSAPSGLPSLRLSLESAAPEETQSKGAGMTFRIGAAPSPFGLCSYAESDRGLSQFRFSSKENGDIETENRREWPEAKLKRDDRRAKTLVAQAFDFPSQKTGAPSLRLWLRGTAFQLQVWKTLLQLPPGKLAAYSSLADRIGQPKAVRAVGNAVGANPIALFIPCHRVIRATGRVQGYRWGAGRKRALIAWESARFQNDFASD